MKVNWKSAKTKNIIIRIVLALVLLALIGAVIGLAIKLDRQTATTRIGGETFSIGTIDAEGNYKEGTTSIYTRRAVTVDGLKCEIAKNAKIKYQLFFYDENDKFISASSELTVDYDGTGVPAKADAVKIMITPLEDSEVTLTEVLGYAKQLTVTVAR